MKYLQSTPFSVALGSKAFRDNWDQTFGKKEEPEPVCVCSSYECHCSARRGPVLPPRPELVEAAAEVVARIAAAPPLSEEEKIDRAADFIANAKIE